MADKGRRLSAVLSTEVFEDLQRIAREKKCTMTQVLRHAITLEKWFHEVQKGGARVMVDRDGQLFELTFL